MEKEGPLDLIIAPDCLFSKIILGKYYHKTSFLKVTENSSISHTWRRILKGRDLLLQHLGKVIGNGETTSLWNDSWIDPETNLKPYGLVFIADKDLMVSNILTRETREWNIQRINSLLPELAAHILSIQPSLLDSQTPTSGRYQRTEPTLSSSTKCFCHRVRIYKAGDFQLTQPVPDVENMSQSITSSSTATSQKKSGGWDHGPMLSQSRRRRPSANPHSVPRTYGRSFLLWAL
ncbi:hypothetical protein DY000_02034686 [Brassica cretica]|uniref:Uncharacterized protein n=1 Tax=Brassica cretica TaxID=69181 RepID=A0ABQ7DMS4_BRACR|nr:hypothetical protein DY000_02034686 [Brassica cretica]